MAAAAAHVSIGARQDRIGDQGVVMAGRTVGASGGHQGCMARLRGVGGLPGVHVTSDTVARTRFPCCQADQHTGLAVVAGGATIVRFRRTADQGIIMAKATGGAADRDYIAVIRLTRVQVPPVRGVASPAGSAGSEGFASGNTDQGTIGPVTAGAGIVNFRVVRIDEWRWIAVTGITTVGPCYCHDSDMINDRLSMNIVKISAVAIGTFSCPTGGIAIGSGTQDSCDRQVTVVAVVLVGAGDHVAIVARRTTCSSG